jgi:hypothetical protein
MKEADFRDMYKKAFKGVCTSTIMISLDSFFPTPSASSTLKTPENTEEGTDDLEPAGERDTQMEYSSNWLCGPNIGAGTKNYM